MKLAPHLQMWGYSTGCADDASVHWFLGGWLCGPGRGILSEILWLAPGVRHAGIAHNVMIRRQNSPISF